MAKTNNEDRSHSYSRGRQLPGMITKTPNYGWQINLHPNTILQGHDIGIIIDLLEQNLMEA